MKLLVIIANYTAAASWSCARSALSNRRPERYGTNYEAKFYRASRDLTYRSAREVIPLILRVMPVGSVCDVGCGALSGYPHSAKRV